MKLIAHRGASLQFQENSVESLVYAAQIGAYAVECDVRQTKDKQYIIFHDDNLSRTAGINARISELALKEIKHHLDKQGYNLITLAELISGYKEKTPILLHIKLTDIDLDFVHLLKNCSIDFIVGIQQPETAELFSAEFPKNRILAFMPKNEDYTAFLRKGAGIIRLWEQWLADTNITEIKNSADGAEVWIMSCDEDGSMNGSIEALNHFEKIGADGVLLNDITLGVEWLRTK